MSEAAQERWIIQRGSGCVLLYWGHVRINGKLTNDMAWTTAMQSARIYSSAKNARNALSKIRKHRPADLLGPVRVIQYIV
jgi:hypothetical protein